MSACEEKGLEHAKNTEKFPVNKKILSTVITNPDEDGKPPEYAPQRNDSGVYLPQYQ
jgi:hypothetical protein